VSKVEVRAENVGSPEAVIDDIRTGEFLLDVEGESAKVRRGARSLQEKLNRALKQLSEDLYSKQTHFVLELIQNADDNDYSPGIERKLTFDVRPDELRVLNNELGFQEKNVRALCDVAKSSKTKKQGYIGEKGIGFKAVFTVSDRPEIHSNGYHFRFDRSSPEDLLGYIVPSWCGRRRDVAEEMTTIILPAKKTVQFNADTFKDVDARILLFLSKLTELDFVYEDKSVHYARKATDSGLLRLETTIRQAGNVEQASTEYLRVEVPFKMDDLREEKRPDFKTSSVVLAFPVNDKGNAAPQKTSQVHAFLPIRRYGFRFSIQADFILSASREGIHTELAWNERLRDAVPIAFCEAVEKFKKTGNLGFTYLKYLPAEGEVSDEFFESIRESVLDELRDMECLPASGGGWKKPASLRTAGPTFRRLFPPDTVRTLFGFDYLDTKVDAPEAVLSELGVEPVIYGDYVRLFRHHSDWVQKQPLAWKAKLYAAMSNGIEALVQAGITKTPCVPLESGRLAVPEDGTVFFPLSRTRKYGFEGDIQTVDAELWELLADDCPQAEQLFGALNVSPDKPYHIITDYIIPAHSGDSPPDGSESSVMGHVRYVKDKLAAHLEGAFEAGVSQSDALQALSESLWVATKNETDDVRTFSRCADMYLSKEYKPAFCIESHLEGQLDDELLISPAYLSSRTKDAEANAKAWHDFFVQLGVRLAPVLEQQNYLSDWKCSEELERLLDSGSSSTRKATLECINQHWTYFSDKLTWSLRQGRSFQTLSSSFSRTLRDVLAPTSRRKSAPLQQSFLRTAEIEELFGDRVVYVDATISERGLLDAAGITYALNWSACLKRLRQMKVEGGETSAQVQRLYRRIESFWSRDGAAIKNAFVTESLIRVKQDERTKWLAPEQVTWRPNSTFLNALYPPLQHQYRDFTAFFTDKLGVKELSTERRVNALKRLEEIADLAARQEEALGIYLRASNDIGRFGRENVSPPSWLSVFRSDSVFLDRHGKLRAANGTLFANDAPRVASQFQSDAAVALLGVSSEQVPRIKKLLAASGVPLVSEAAQTTVHEATHPRIDQDLTSRLRAALPFVARAMYVKDHDRFEVALNAQRFSTLKLVDVCRVGSLSVKWTLGPASAICDTEVAAGERRMFVKADARSTLNRVAMELCRILGASDTLADVVALLLRESTAEDAEELLQLRGIGNLPSELANSLFKDGPSDTTEAAADNEPDLGEDISQTPREESEASAADEPPEADAMPVPPSSSPLAGPANRTPKKGPSTFRKPDAAKGAPPEDTPSSEERTGGVEPSAAPLVQTLKDLAGGEPTLTVRPSPVVNTAVASGAENPGPLNPSATRPGSKPARNGTSRPADAGRLLSYADAPKDSEAADPTSDERGRQNRSEVESAAVQYFLDCFGSRWKTVRVMPPNNPGFDIHATSLDGQEEFIEVKGQSGPWNQAGVIVTPRELQTASVAGANYWLGIVEFALAPDRRSAYLLQNPFWRTMQFRYDSGWREFASRATSKPLVPKAGLGITIPDLGKGTIVTARAKGRFYKLHVRLATGAQVHRVFNPDTMSLHSD
jgi:hypothetical protein